MTVRLAVSVEGDTEERFVKDILAPHLMEFEVYAIPTMVATGRTADGARAKGGGINRDRVVGEIRRLLSGYADGFVTSFYDFYGFERRRQGETVDELQQSLAELLGRPRNFIPYIQLYEFEALLLSNPAVVAEYFDAPRLAPAIEQVVRRAGGAELVNDGPATAPSKRLEAWTTQHAPTLKRFTKKTKVRHGGKLAETLTLPVIRNACPRFDAWVTRLERLGNPMN